MRKTLFLLVVLCASALSFAALADRAEKASDKSNLATIPFELVLKHVLINLKVNNSPPLPFILDTGDKFAIIDLDRAKELGLSLKGDIQSGGAGAAILHGAYVQGSSFALVGLEGHSQPITLAFPLKSLEKPMGHEIDGVIGGDFIKDFVIGLDYQSRMIRLYDKETFRYTGEGQSIPIELNADGHPIIEAEITPDRGVPIKGKFMLDIGSSASLALYSPFVAEHHLLTPDLKTIRALGAAGAGGKLKGRIGRVEELRIGRFSMARPITFFSQDEAGAFATSNIQGNIGEQVLSRFTIFLDYGHSRVIFEPNKTYGQPFATVFAGAVLEGDGSDFKTLRITDVLEDSPASEAGIQKGDVITAVDGRPASQLSVNDVSEMFERPGSYHLNVKRGDSSLQITLRPRKLV